VETYVLMWSNFHSHCNYCDGKGELHEYLAAAKNNRLFTVGFSSHAPVPFDCKWCMNGEDLPAYLEEIHGLRNSNPDIEIYKSLEIDFIPGVVSPADFKNVLDYTIGSIHFIDRLPDGRPWEIDNTPAVFREGLEKIFNNNFQDVIHRYFELTREMIHNASPDIIGHVDKIKMQNVNGKFFNETDAWYKEEIVKTITLIAEADLIVEVNTRGIYQKKTSTTYPSPWILEMIKEKNIRVTISSDAHHPADIINQFPETALLLQQIGFKNMAALTEGKWKQIPFNDNGFIR
jgi:histidinol-phosphatase (PHP family)